MSLYYCRKRLFGLINELPTVYEVVSGRKSTKEKAINTTNGSSTKEKTINNINGSGTKEKIINTNVSSMKDKIVNTNGSSKTKSSVKKVYKLVSM